jgi:hypothetical protein
MKFGCLVAGGVRGGDAMQLLDGVPKNITESALASVSRVVFGSRACAPMAILSVSLVFNAAALMP